MGAGVRGGGFPNIPQTPLSTPTHVTFSGHKRGNKGCDPLKRTKLAQSVPMPRDLQDLLAFVKRLWGAHVEENTWYEPSRICTDHPLLSITMVQGWMVWSVVYACWLVHCESLSAPAEKTRLQGCNFEEALWSSKCPTLRKRGLV